MTKSLAKELASRSVTCNCIAPGFIRTDMTDAMPDNIRSRRWPISPKEDGKPRGRGGGVLCPTFSYITGEVIKVDGGLYI